MKKVLSFFAAAILTGTFALAQVPQAFNYQGIARNATGGALSTATLGLRLTIHNGSASGPIVYQETQTATTNAYGLYMVSVGMGSPVTGTFTAINWANGNLYMEVEMDPTGGTSYTVLGTSQLLSVPYAMFSNNAGHARLADTATVFTGTVNMGGDVTGTNAAATVVKLQGKSVSATAPTSNQVLEWNSGTSAWTPTTLPVAPTYTAGTGITIAGTTISAQNTSALWNANELEGNAISATAPVTGQGLVWSGTAWTPTALGGTGTVTSITATAPLTGGTITTTGSIGLGTVGVAGTYGSSTRVPVITTDAYGRVTAASTATITTGVAGTTNYIPKFTSGTAIGNSAMYQNGNYIGIGTIAASHPFDVETTTDTILAYFGNSGASASGQAAVVYNYMGATDPARTGIWGSTIHTTTDTMGTGIEGDGNFAGLFGYGATANTSANRNVYGTYGYATSDGYPIGVRGSGNNNTGTPGNTAGVYGDGQGGTFNAGVLGTATGTSGIQNTGVFGNADGSTTNIGVHGVSTGTTGTNNIGVYGEASGASTANWAGYFVGDVYVNGTLSKAGGTFKIDHPQDPENKYLIHSFVESNDMMNIYNGNVTTDASGKATVTLPTYFEALNKDFRYQLTPIGSFAQAMISKEVAGNKFEITTNIPNVKISWMVTGVRQDAWANAHRVQAEVEKEPSNKGKYLNAKEYGQPETNQIMRSNPIALPGKVIPAHLAKAPASDKK